MKIAAAVAHGRSQPFRLEVVDLEQPRPDEVLVRILGVGLCHTDLVFRDMTTEVEFPVVLGHEGSGEVVAIGANVNKVRPGDKVCLTFHSCGDCPQCLEGNPAYCNLLPILNFRARRGDGSKALSKDGVAISSHFFGQSSFASHALANQRNVVKVASTIPIELLGPLGCGVQTGAGAVMRSLNCGKGSSLLIFGGGSVGLSAVMGGYIRGCGPIIVVEPHAARRRLAEELGATHTIDPNETDVAGAVRAIVPGGVRYALDTAGREAMLEAAIASLGSHGTLGVVATNSTTQQLPGNLFAFISQGLTIKGIIEGDSDPDVFIPELLSYHAEGRFPFEKLITTFPFEQINDAIEAQHRGECVKVVLLMASPLGGI